MSLSFHIYVCVCTCMCVYIHFILAHINVYVCIYIYMYFKLCPGPNLRLNCGSNPATGACSCSPQPALPRRQRLSAALLHSHLPALAPAALKRDKPVTSPARPADKASCEDVLSLPVFLPPHLSCSQFSVGTCHRGFDFHSFLPAPSALLRGAKGVYRRKHLHSRGWPPHRGRLIRVECTSFGQRTPITATAPAAQCGRTSDSSGPASSTLSSRQALSVPSLNYILFTNTRPDFRWNLNKGWQRSGPRHEDVICLCALADKWGGGGGGAGLISEIAQKNTCRCHAK